jgi:hypothetical protein
LNPLTWLGRVLALCAVEKQLRAAGYVRGSIAGGDAIALALSLVDRGTAEAEAVEQLQAMPGGQAALQNAAAMLARYASDGYPHGAAYQLLRAASDGSTAP